MCFLTFRILIHRPAIHRSNSGLVMVASEIGARRSVQEWSRRNTWRLKASRAFADILACSTGWGIYNSGFCGEHLFLCNISPSSSCLKLSVLILAPPTRKFLLKFIPPFQSTYLSFSCVGVWQNDRVEIIANDQGNRTTPSYVSFSDNERLIGDAAKNQVAMNPHNT